MGLGVAWWASRHFTLRVGSYKPTVSHLLLRAGPAGSTATPTLRRLPLGWTGKGGAKESVFNCLPFRTGSFLFWA